MFLFIAMFLCAMASVGAYLLIHLIYLEIKCRNEIMTDTSLNINSAFQDKKKQRKIEAEKIFNKCEEKKAQKKASCFSENQIQTKNFSKNFSSKVITDSLLKQLQTIK